ncbi:RNA polymerase sigma factor [Enterococcus hirae]|uniref:RNA polymerase sigma factor n=1 Tax=unclassified Enterococcus TaxID=2608891 RepID=UPI0019EFE25F|nr:RNA polymerase sigma factor [Enterococcus hirae]EMF0404981.1 RNA polymerase sigma factor [Enterococcus hirae]EMF0419497.1 RNA polymerase sigma factor [Enterococcus hirae]EMF0513118.1 RNA polymerase sigma factor [Enterococcus hirae]
MGPIFNRYKKKKQIEKSKNLLSELIREEYEKMFRITMNYVHNKEEALDVMQDSFHKALAAIEQGKEIEQFSAWFYRILIRTAIDAWRKQKRNQSETLEEETIQLAHTMDDSLTDLHGIIEGIDSPEKEILILHFFEGFRLKEIAEILDLNENTVKTKMYRTLNQLRKILQ